MSNSRSTPTRRLVTRPPHPVTRLSVEPSAAPAAGVTVTYAAAGCVIGHLRNMTFCAWDTAPTAEHVDAFIALAEQLSKTYALNSNVSLVMPNADLPGSAGRTALERLTSEYASAIHSVALVIDGTGFRTSLIRSFLTGLHLLRGNGYRCKTFGQPLEVNPWLLPSHNADTGVGVTEREVQESCDVLFARMAGESAPIKRRA